MSKIMLNKKEFEGLAPDFVDQLSLRLRKAIAKSRKDRVAVDYLVVVGELSRLAPSIKVKDWYKDFVLEFCSQNRIPCDVRNI